MLKLILFDLDGTLVDSRRDIALSVNLTLDRFGFARREPEIIFGFIGGGVHNLIRNSFPPEGGGRVEEGVDAFWEIYREHVLDTTRLYPGVVGMLESLSGFTLGVVTNKPYAHTVMVLEGLGVASYFRTVHGWRPGVPVKPDPAMLLSAIKDIGARKEDAVLVGDSMNDLLAAKNAGVRFCAVGYGYGGREKMRDAGADFFAEGVEDIQKAIAPSSSVS